jgi:hypothetical protein
MTQYPALMDDMDIGIAPIAHNDFNRGKSDLKYLEYTMAGVLPIVQKFGPYMHLPKSSCVHADTVEEWADAIEFYVNNPRHRRNEYQKAMSYVINQRTIYNNAGRWYKALKDLIM